MLWGDLLLSLLMRVREARMEREIQTCARAMAPETLEYPQSIAPLNAMVLFCIPSKNKPATMVKRESL